MDRIEAMTVFAAAVEMGSLSAAGRKLHMPLATVSRKLMDLETHLNTRLLSRSTRSLSLTDAGHAYLIACKRILEDVREAERAAGGEYVVPQGELVVTAPHVFGRIHVLPVVSDFLKQQSEVQVRLVLGDRVLNLAEDQIDLAVRIGSLSDSSMQATRVGSTGHVACASRAYLKRRGTPATPADLVEHDCITFDALMSARAWRFADGMDVDIRSRLVVNSAEASIDAARAGLGITRVLSYQVESAIRRRELVRLMPDFEPAAVPISLLFSRHKRLPLKLRSFLDFAAPRLRERLKSVNGA